GAIGSSASGIAGDIVAAGAGSDRRPSDGPGDAGADAPAPLIACCGDGTGAAEAAGAPNSSLAIRAMSSAIAAGSDGSGTGGAAIGAIAAGEIPGLAPASMPGPGEVPSGDVFVPALTWFTGPRASTGRSNGSLVLMVLVDLDALERADRILHQRRRRAMQ